MKPISRSLAAHLAPTIMRTVKVNKEGCWERKVAAQPNGYTRVSIRRDGRTVYYFAHRIMFVFWNDEIPEGLVIDHLCDNPPCCNPDHLRACTMAENILRSPVAPAAVNARKGYCERGHSLTVIGERKRQCVTCARDRTREQRIQRRLQGIPADEPHGTRRAYHYWSCRCEQCREWQRVDYRQRKAEGRVR